MPLLGHRTATRSQNAYLIALEKTQNQARLSKMHEILYAGNYPEYIKYLYRLGTSLQESWQLDGRTRESGKKEFKEYIVEQIAPHTNNKPQTLRKLCESAANLEVILTVWEDPGLDRREKAERQAHKVKRIIDITDRHAIHTALFAEVANIINRINLRDSNESTREANSEIQKINEAFEALVEADSKLDNKALGDILKHIKLLNNTGEKTEGADFSEKISQLLEISRELISNKEHNKKILEEIFDSIAKNEKRNEELLEEILDPVNWRHNERFLEAILYRINENKRANKKLLEKIHSTESPNKELLKVAHRIGENEERNEKLLSTIVDYIDKKEKQNENSLREIVKHKQENKNHTQKLREKNFKHRGQSSELLKNNLDRIAKNEEEIGELEFIIERINEDKKGAAQLLRKIHSVSEDKKKKEKIEKLLGENSPITEDTFNAWDPTEEAVQESQKLLLGVEAAVKSKKVKKVLTSFKTPTDNAISRTSVFLSVLAGLSCGVVTSGCIFLLLIGAVPLGVGITIGVLVFFAGFFANFNFFSYAIPEFLLKLAKAGGITEFIDKDGKRAQLSTRKKLLLIPAALLSVAVGVCVCAFTLMSGMQVAAILPFLVAAGPALPAILVGTLAVAICIAMSIIMFRAFVGILQKPYSFAQLRQNFVKTLSEMTISKALGYAGKGLIVVFAIFSLYFLCFTGIPTLTIAFGSTVAHIFGFASFVGQIPFCAVTVSNFCNFATEWVTKKFFPAEHAPTGKVSEVLKGLNEPAWSNKGFFSRCFSFIKRVFVPGSLPANAAGNGALVVVRDSPITYVAAAGNILISIAGNMVPNEAGEARERTQADKVIVHDIIKSPKVSIPNDDIHSDLSASSVATSSSTPPPSTVDVTRVFPQRQNGVAFSRTRQTLFGGRLPPYTQLNDEQVPAARPKASVTALHK